jgi:hypothetical protein
VLKLGARSTTHLQVHMMQFLLRGIGSVFCVLRLLGVPRCVGTLPAPDQAVAPYPNAIVLVFNYPVKINPSAWGQHWAPHNRETAFGAVVHGVGPFPQNLLLDSSVVCMPVVLSPLCCGTYPQLHSCCPSWHCVCLHWPLTGEAGGAINIIYVSDIFA